jgi:hypothetical protein
MPFDRTLAHFRALADYDRRVYWGSHGPLQPSIVSHLAPSCRDALLYWDTSAAEMPLDVGDDDDMAGCAEDWADDLARLGLAQDEAEELDDFAADFRHGDDTDEGIRARYAAVVLWLAHRVAGRSAEEATAAVREAMGDGE